MIKKILFFALTCSFFIACKKDEQVSLFNKWNVESYIFSDTSLAVVSSENIIFNFTDSNKVYVDLSANSCFSSYTIDAGKMDVESLACTKKCCDSAFSLKIKEMCDSVKTYEIINKSLLLKGEKGLKIKLLLKE